MERVLKHPGEKSIGWALLQAARLHRTRMGDKLATHGLFAGQEQVLQALAAGPMTMSELSRILRVRPPTASKTVSRLRALGLVEREAEKEDGRVVWAKLSKEGVTKAAIIEELWDEVEGEILFSLEPKERKRLRKYLRKIANSLAPTNGLRTDKDLVGMNGEMLEEVSPVENSSISDHEMSDS